MIAAALILASAFAVERPAPLPPPLPAMAWVAPEAQLATLSNGLDVVIVTAPELPTFEIRLLVGVGAYVDPPDKAGLAQALFELAPAGTPHRDADAISATLRRLGASLDGTLVGGHTGEIRVTGLVRNLEPTLDVWADVIRAPTYPEVEVGTWRSQQIAGLERADRDPAQVGARAFWRIVYGDTYIGRSPTRDSLGALSSTDLTALHQRHVGPENAVILVGGDLTKAEVVPLLEARLGAWAPAGIEPAPVVAQPRTVDRPVLYFIDSAGAAQSQILVGGTIGTRTDPGHHAMEVANQAFGGAFTSRLNLNLREAKGYTYGARCTPRHAHGEGQLSCQTSVQTEVTGPALREIRSELEAILGDRPLGEGEVARASAKLAQQWPMALETLGAKLDQEVAIWRHGLPEDWVARYVPAVNEVTTASANQAFRDAVSLDRLFWLVVGDGAAIREDLDAFGLPVVELDRWGAPLGRSE